MQLENFTPRHMCGRCQRHILYAKCPSIIGLYGVSGCGKSFQLDGLKDSLDPNSFAFFEGSEVIGSLVPGGLQAFATLNVQKKYELRQDAIERIRGECMRTNRMGVVAGHYMFWNEGESGGNVICTSHDLHTYTHIVYLKEDPRVIKERRQRDTKKSRGDASTMHLEIWQQKEIAALRNLCRDNGIIFTIGPAFKLGGSLTQLVSNLHELTEEKNLENAEAKLDSLIGGFKGSVETMLVIDADRTLAAEDTGKMFWDNVSNGEDLKQHGHPLELLFNSKLAYSYKAFIQAALLYEEVADEDEFNALCDMVASAVTLYPEFTLLLRILRSHKHVGAVLVTCGLGCVWEKVLKRADLENVKVIGGGRISERLVVTDAVKKDLVAYLQDVELMYVWAFGDSPLDLDMLKQANQAIVVVGDKKSRSHSMDKKLEEAVYCNGLRARQALLPNTVTPRLDLTKLEQVWLTDENFINSVVSRQRRYRHLKLFQATKTPASKLLATPMRDSGIAGPELRAAHRRVGWYLAVEYLTDVIGLERRQITHVQERTTHGFGLAKEQNILILALMRGGEPMASGVNNAFPLAMFLHAKKTWDVKDHHVKDCHTVVLVDSVVNNGDTIIDFAKHINDLQADIRIVVVTGVTQHKAPERIGRELDHSAKVTMVALRLSNTKFKGTRSTDTGNRLFNTTHLD